jgi:hypothetical protein
VSTPTVKMDQSRTCDGHDRGQHEGSREHPHALREGPHQEEQGRHGVFDANAESPRQHLVGREDLAAGDIEEQGHEQPREQHARDHVAGDDLQVRQAAALLGAREGAKGDRRNANEGERARLGSDDGHADDPPRRPSPPDEVFRHRMVCASEPHPERRDAGEVCDEHDGVDARESHARPSEHHIRAAIPSPDRCQRLTCANDVL